MSVAARQLPSVDKVLRDLGETDLPRATVLAVVRRELATLRAELQSPNHPAQATDPNPRIRAALDDLRRARIQPVINGTGIVVHTNLGRSPLGAEVVRAVTDAAANYTNLEYNLTGGARGGRAAYLEHNLALLCEAGAATIVNNCAAALVLVLRHFAAKAPRNQVVISRGELVQIGGGFRVPEILEASGAVLREVGTTNRTTAEDYSRAVGAETALLLRVHRSNFYMGGFVESPTTAELAVVAQNAGVPFLEDLGSGAMFRTEELGGGEHEPTPADVLRQGADLVCFSGDKLLGGPQAGIIAGKAGHVAALKKDPFFRALRCDKLILSALQATVDLHLHAAAASDTNATGIPALDLMRIDAAALRPRAEALKSLLADLPLTVTFGEGESRPGGGSLPRTVIPSVTLDLLPRSLAPDAFAARMRGGTPPVIGYVSNDRFRLDLRTIFPHQDGQVIEAIRQVVGGDPLASN